MAKVGRRSLLTPELQEKICKAIAVGALYKSAAQANGISYDTFMEWMQRGRGEGTRRKSNVFAQFARAVEQAQGQARVLTEGALRKERPLEYLARRWPEDWGPKGDELPQTRIQVGLSDDAATAFLGALFPQRLTLTNGHGPKPDDE